MLAAQLERLVARRRPARRLRAAAAPLRDGSWSRVADELEGVYARARRAPPRRPRRRRGRRSGSRAGALIDVDLHMHTDHSPDCATPVEVLLATARDQGLGAIAVTDHNEVSGALEAAEKAAEFGVKVIVAEEVKTAVAGRGHRPVPRRSRSRAA